MSHSYKVFASPSFMGYDRALMLPKENISNVKFIAWDTETTGHDPKNSSLVEIAAVAFDEEFEQRTFETLVKPHLPMTPGALAVHGINDAMVESAPQPLAAMNQFFDFLHWVGTPRILLAHNAGYDVEILHQDWKRGVAAQEIEVSQQLKLGLESVLKTEIASEIVPEIVVDTCMLAKNLLPELPNHKLKNLVEYFKLPSRNHHRALEDVRGLKEVFLKLLEIASNRLAESRKEFTVEALADLAGGYFVLHPIDSLITKQPFKLPTRIAALETLCGTDTKIEIVYGSEEDCRYITPMQIRIRGFKIYLDAFCHRDNIKKTFRADKILKIVARD